MDLELLKKRLYDLMIEKERNHDWGVKDNPIRATILALMLDVEQRDLRRAIESMEVDLKFNRKIDFTSKGYFLTDDFAAKRKRENRKIKRAVERLKEYARIEQNKTQIRFFDSLEDYVNE